MMINSQRILAAAAAALVAALTGIATATITASASCTLRPATPTATAGGSHLEDAQSPRATPPAPTAEITQSGSCQTTTNPTLAGALGFAGAGLAGLTAAVLLGAAPRHRRRPATPPRPPGGPAPSMPGGQPSTAAIDTDRATLAQACIYVRDRVTSRALGDRLAAALATAGINAVEPIGARFDPARHEAGGTTATGDPARAGTVAAVEVTGYRDRDGHSLRVPVVTVYRLQQHTDQPRPRADRRRDQNP
jgi:hypothetical protein